MWIHNIKDVTCDIENVKCGRRKCKNVEVLYAFEVELLITLKMDSYKMLYVSFMVSTKQKLIDKQKRKRKESKHTTIEYHQNTEEDSKIRKDAQKSCKTY